MLIDETSHETAEEGENYFVSMTDMMVGVLFIFIIMLMVFALEFRTHTQDQTNTAAEVAKRLEEIRSKVQGEITILDEAQKTRQRLLQELKDKMRTQGLNVQVDEANGVLRLTENAVRFQPGSYELVDPRTVPANQAMLNVAKIAEVLKDVLPTYAACRGDRVCATTPNSTIETVFIEGHTDITGSPDLAVRERTNWLLSTFRSVNTYREVVAKAPELRGLRNSKGEEIISVAGYSSTRPIDPRDTPEAWAKNRRIDLRFVMEVNSRQRLQEILKLTDEMKEQIRRLERSDGS